jgi:hypothetical protein
MKLLKLQGDGKSVNFFFDGSLLETLESKTIEKLDMEQPDFAERTKKRMRLDILLRKIYLELNQAKT